MPHKTEHKGLTQPAPLDPMLPPAGGTSEAEQVDYYLSRSLITLKSSDSLLTAIKLMSQYNIGGLPVIDNRIIKGVITEKSLISAISGSKDINASVAGFTEEALTVPPDKSIMGAIDKLRQKHAKYLLVIEPHGGIRGMISQTDLLEASRAILSRQSNRLAALHHLAYRDPLTNLATRRLFDKAIKKEFNIVSRFSGLLTLVMLDLDHFKNVNDQYGHPAGDMVLREVGAIIQSHIRKADLAARYGGEEFTILLPGSGTRMGFIVAESIRKDLQDKIFDFQGKTFSLTISAGLCKWTRELSGPQEMVQAADEALYRAKEKGRNRIELI